MIHTGFTLTVLSVTACVCTRLIQQLPMTTPPTDISTMPHIDRSTSPPTDRSTAIQAERTRTPLNDIKISSSVGKINRVRSNDTHSNTIGPTLPKMEEPNSVDNFNNTHSQDVTDKSYGMTNAVMVDLGNEKFLVCFKDTCQNRCIHKNVRKTTVLQSSLKKYIQNDFNILNTTNVYLNHVIKDARAENANIPDENSVEHQFNADAFSQEDLGVGSNIEEAVDFNSQGQPSFSSGTKPRKPHHKERITADISIGQTASCPRCFCDKLCVLYGDCCPDFFETCFGLKKTNDVLSFITGIRGLHSGWLFTGDDGTPLVTDRNVQNIVELATCEKVNNGVAINLIGRCPSANQNASLVEKCENILLQLPPVSVSFPTGNVTFRNVFCAHCHGISDGDMLAWSSGLTCNSSVTIDNKQRLSLPVVSELITAGRCSISFYPPGNVCSIRQCDSNVTLDKKRIQQTAMSNLSKDCSKADLELCQSYIYAIDGFRNIHCMKCLDSKRWKAIEKLQEVNCYSLCFGNHETLGGVSNGGILIILDITGAYRQVNGGSETSYICQDFEVFDSLTYTCRTLVCPPWHEPYRGRCVESSQTHLFDGTTQLFPKEWKSLSFRMTTEIEESRSCELLVTLLNSTNFIVQEKQEILLAKHNESSHNEDCYKFHREWLNQIEYPVKQLLTQTLKSAANVVVELMELTNQMAPLNFEGWPYQMVVSNRMNLTSPWPSCPDDSPPNLIKDFTIVTNYSTDIFLINISSYEVYFPYRNIGFEFSLNYLFAKNKNFTINQTLAVCDINLLFFRTNCSIIKYRFNETFQNESGLIVLSSQQKYNIGDFHVRNDVVLVCSDFKYVSMIGDIKTSLPYMIVSWIFTLISTIFLLLMLALYWLLPELLTLPGKMTASLAATMMLTFLSNSFSLHNLRHKYICPVVGALSHIVTLAHFGWMSSISVNMALTFGPLANTLARSQNDNTIFRRYCLVVWGISLILVITSVTFDLTHTDPPMNSDNDALSMVTSEYPRYGYPFCTWFSGPLWARLAFIIIPYLITFIISLIGFIMTLVGIQNASKNSEKLGKNTSERARCLIYIKLSSAMGFSWIISVVMSIYPEKEVLPYIYVCLVLLQGILLFLSFMVNQRVYSLLLKRFKTNSGLLSRSGSTQESVITSKSL